MLVLIADEDQARWHATEATSRRPARGGDRRSPICSIARLRLGPQSTFAEREAMAATVMAEVRAELQLAAPKEEG